MSALRVDRTCPGLFKYAESSQLHCSTLVNKFGLAVNCHGNISNRSYHEDIFPVKDQPPS